MFRDLKNKLATQVTKTNQTVFSSILPAGSALLFGDSASISSRDDNHENIRSRLDSSASDTSQTANYVSPTRQTMPPSDIESELGSEESETLEIYKNKFTQLKKAYDEVEHEIEDIKNALHKCQDAALKQKAELREQIQHEKQNLQKKITTLAGALARSEEEIKNHQEKRVELMIERDNLSQRLHERQRSEEINRLRQSSDEEKSALKIQLEHFKSQFEIEGDSYRKEIERLKREMLSLININEEYTRRIDEFANETFNFREEINGKDFHLQKLTKDYEQRLKEQEMKYNTQLKAMAKEMSTQIDDKERNYQQQLQNFIHKNQKTQNELVNNSEQKSADAEQRALIAEKQLSKMDEQLKEEQLDHYRVVQDLQNQIEHLRKEKTRTTEQSAQTIIEDVDLEHSHLVESVEIDYLKKIILAYMTGTDPLTMVKVICAVLRYTEAETSSIIEHETLRQSRWLNSSR